jgi:dinuclear metal center YbgI/SA1388 family protein
VGFKTRAFLIGFLIINEAGFKSGIIMAPTLSEIIQILDDLAPPFLAEEWDNCGLQLGDPAWPITKIWVALDPTLQVVEAACDQKVDLLVTHHPLIFKPLKSIEFHTPLGAVLNLATRKSLAIFAAHTNLDSAAGGLNDILARRIGLKDLKPLIAGKEITRYQYDNYPLISGGHRPGIGRVGYLAKAVDLKSFARKIKKEMGLKKIKFAGDPHLKIEKAAVCTGSGSSLLGDFFTSGAQAYISGDMRYHDARDVEAANLGVIDIGHFSSESFIAEELAARLSTIFAESGIEVTVEACDIEKEPFQIL